LVISDDGSGISPGNRDRIFDPFFTTNRDGGGTGMGLAIVRRLLSAHGATIALQDDPGAVFEIEF
jgi:signal transduction histidine kinase